MKKKLTTEFQTRLWEAVKAIEHGSQVEVVAIIRSRSGDYRDIALSWGIVGALLSFTYVMFAPDLFDDWLIYGAPVVAFAASCMAGNMPFLIRLSAAKSRLQKNVEIMARALFQKGGIQHTQAKTGVLVYCSWLEKTVYILPDRGVETAVPVEEWRKLRAEFQQIFTHNNPSVALLEQLHKSQALFEHYLPQLPGDINELPDDMEIDL